MGRHRLRFKTAAVAMVFALGLMACSGAKITQENFDKIKTGMTLAEVKAILGEPADFLQYRGGGDVRRHRHVEGGKASPSASSL